VTLRADGRPLAVELKVADSFKARTFGLAGASVRPCDQTALWLPRTRSIHTFGMCFNLALIWLNRDGRILRIDSSVAPRRFVTCIRAASVIELPSSSLSGFGIVNGMRLTA
jgi:uncharacterized membrane protein (UPF0127 family)